MLKVAFAFAMCWLSAMLGVLVHSAQGVQLYGFLFMFPLVFGSNILTSTGTMPGWLQAFVRVNPVTHLVIAERNLMAGQPAASQVAWVLLASGALVAVFAPVTAWLYGRQR